MFEMLLHLENLEHYPAVHSPLNQTQIAQMQIFTEYENLTVLLVCQEEGLKISVGLTRAPTQITRPVIHTV